MRNSSNNRSNVANFILKTLLTYFILVGVKFVVLSILFTSLTAATFENRQDIELQLVNSEVWISLCTSLIFSAAVPLFAFGRRPVPRNPIQQLMLNCFVVFFSILAVLPGAILIVQLGYFLMLQNGSLSNPDYQYSPVPTGIIPGLVLLYYFGYVANTDPPVMSTPYGRNISYWKKVIADSKRRKIN